VVFVVVMDYMVLFWVDVWLVVDDFGFVGDVLFEYVWKLW